MEKACLWSVTRVTPVLALVGAMLVSPAMAQTKPFPGDRTISLVVGFAPGGFADSFARVIADELGRKWNATVIVENNAGAGGNIATANVASRAADGYRVLVTTTAIAINSTLYVKPGYNLNDLTPVAVPVSSAESIATNPSRPKSLKAFLEAFKDKEVSFATAGVGSGSHIAAEYFLKNIAKVKALHVPFRGGNLSVQAAVGNQVDLVASSFGVAAQVNDGKLTGLAVGSAARVPSMPSVPTYTESGYPFQAESWVGLFVPAKTPADIIQKYNASILEIMADPSVKAKLTSMGFQQHRRTVEESTDYVKDEVVKWGTMVKAIDLKVDQ
ncbi:Bug family tripartite tricarboxylate transporter substrate binding protein [Variovorax sp. HJSM1_2]|uniref:Bug family tripartite tricarboxylate transporter substrate binding protein n=1 Tax=Variovorax sp. HJSM1_2 TaxID=3366263 RepID=UPI003BD2442C